MDMIRVLLNAREPIWVTYSVAASEGKKTEEGMTMSTPEPASNSVAVADPTETQNLTPAAMEEASDIVTNCRIDY
jgi:hypothetical protein